MWAAGMRVAHAPGPAVWGLPTECRGPQCPDPEAGASGPLPLECQPGPGAAGFAMFVPTRVSVCPSACPWRGNCAVCVRACVCGHAFVCAHRPWKPCAPAPIPAACATRVCPCPSPPPCCRGAAASLLQLPCGCASPALLAHEPPYALSLAERRLRLRAALPECSEAVAQQRLDRLQRCADDGPERLMEQLDCSVPPNSLHYGYLSRLYFCWGSAAGFDVRRWEGVPLLDQRLRTTPHLTRGSGPFQREPRTPPRGKFYFGAF